jgi:Ala-tRNA(Pro) deacylase
VDPAFGPQEEEDVNALLPAPEEREAALYRRFTELAISWMTYAHTPVFTVEEARALRGSLPGGHTKNLFLKDKKDGLWLVVLREELRVDLNALARQLGAPRFSFGSPERLASALGVPAGSVTPFALINDTRRAVRVVLDEGMLALDPLNSHPLRNDRTTAVSADDLMRFVRSGGHDPIVCRLAELAA